MSKIDKTSTSRPTYILSTTTYVHTSSDADEGRHAMRQRESTSSFLLTTMKLLLPVAAAAICATGSAFVPSNGVARSVAAGPLHSTEESTTPCAIPEGVDAAPDLTSQPGSAQLLRSNVVTNAEGDFVQLGEAMGTGTSVVVFLRHMG